MVHIHMGMDVVTVLHPARVRGKPSHRRVCGYWAKTHRFSRDEDVVVLRQDGRTREQNPANGQGLCQDTDICARDKHRAWCHLTIPQRGLTGRNRKVKAVFRPYRPPPPPPTRMRPPPPPPPRMRPPPPPPMIICMVLVLIMAKHYRRIRCCRNTVQSEQRRCRCVNEGSNFV